MKVTICQFSDERCAFRREWSEFRRHLIETESELVLLPEMIFSSWFANSQNLDMDRWHTAVQDHAELSELSELPNCTWLGSRPVAEDNKRYNRGYVFTQGGKISDLHAKSYLPEQNNVFEQTWFHRGDFDYRLYEINQWKVGTVICSELWFMRHIQAYGDQGAHLIACPRAGARSSTARWLIAGQAAAIIAGAYCISSNRASEDFFGGVGWIISPEGDILAHTSKETPFVTMELDLSQPTEAKSTYPRYIPRSPSDIPEFTNIGS